MKTEDLVTALQPLAGWYIHGISYKLNNAVPCYAVRELAESEQEQHGRDVLLATDEEYTGFPPGIVLLAENVVRVDWAGDRVYIEAKHDQLGHIQRVRPIETIESIESSEGAQNATW